MWRRVLVLVAIGAAACGTVTPGMRVSQLVTALHDRGVLRTTWDIPGDSHRWAITPLIRYAESKDYRVVFVHEMEHAYAQTWIPLRYIEVKAGMGANMTVACLIHEFGHIHAPVSFVRPDEAGRADREVFAEAVDYFVTQRLGLDITLESFSYMAAFDPLRRDFVLTKYGPQIEAASKEIADFVLRAKPATE